MAEKRTWLRRKIDLLENHKLVGPFLLVVFLLGLIGGIMSFTREVISFAKSFSNEAPGILATIEVQNSRSNLVTIDPICDLEVIEQIRNSTGFYSGLGEKLRLDPLDSAAGTNAFCLQPAARCRYRVHLPDNELCRDLIARGVATLEFTVWTVARESAQGTISLQTESLLHDRSVITF